jgi:hypothetical protein
MRNLRPSKRRAAPDSAPVQRHRVRVLQALARMARTMVALQPTDAARTACAEVADQLQGLVARERRAAKRAIFLSK